MKHLTALLTEEGHAFITELFSQDTTKEADSSEAESNWADQDYQDQEYQGQVYIITSMDLKDIQEKLTEAYFIHTTELKATLDRTKGPKFSNKTDGEPFKGVRMDTCANHTSVIGISK